MTAIATNDPTSQVENQSVLTDRFILTEVDKFTLVFPAIWVTDILRIDRSQILDLPFYDSLIVGIINHNGQITPLVATARTLKVKRFSLPEKLLVVRLNQVAGTLANVGFIIDRAIASSTRDKLPANLFTATPTTASEMVLMCPELIPAEIWQPQRWR
jgi:chemotaxis signal transduction protein